MSCYFDIRDVFYRNGFVHVILFKPGADESQKTLNKCEARNKTVFHTRLRHPETINSVPLNSVLRIKQTGVYPILHLEVTYFWITNAAKGRHRRESKNKKQETKRFSTFAVYRLRHSETEKKHCLIRESSFSGACAKEPINNLSQVTWLCTWLPK